MTSLPTLLALLERSCTQHQVEAGLRHDLHLIVEEACVNVISYAYPAGAPGLMSLQLEVGLRAGRKAMDITIEDQGSPFDPLALPPPDLTAPLDELPVGGLGVHLLRELSDQQRYRHDRRRGNVLTITKWLAPPA